MADKPAQERTEKATPRKRAEARKEGKVARSQDLSSMAILVFGIAALYFLLPNSLEQIQGFAKFIFANATSHSISATNFTLYFKTALTTFAVAIGPILLLLAVIGVAINLMQVGFLFTAKPLEPKLDKLDIVQGMTKLVSVRSLFELFKNVAKLAVIGIVAVYAVKAELDTVPVLPDLSVSQILGMFGAAAFRVAIKCSIALVVIAVIDYAFQKWEFEKQLRMTKQEIKEEGKDTEGNPQIKGKIRQLQREQSMRRMMADVKKADVVVTNPTEYAVAIQYDSDAMDAPTVIAKGQRLVAKHIKELAKEHDVPIVENKPLARALFKACEVGAQIPPKFFKAVAEVLAYVYRLKGKV